MESFLRVLRPGLHSLIVDRGRLRSRSLGVPVGGAADCAALILGNALVGNPPDTAGLECTLQGPSLRAETSLGCVVVGAPSSLHTDRKSLIHAHAFNLEPGETLYLGTIHPGMRAYLCVRGGFLTPTVLGSRSALAPVSADALLPVSAGTVPRRFIDHAWIDEQQPVPLRITRAAQTDWFDPSPLEQGTFMVRPQSNRMGLRLEGPILERFQDHELLSEPVCPGTVQVTRDGQAVILGVDGQTIGGYPKIAHVIDADLDRIGQLRPGQAVRFHWVSHADAESLARDRRRDLRHWILRLAHP